jgi:hypothetical protein
MMGGSASDYTSAAVFVDESRDWYRPEENVSGPKENERRDEKKAR